MLLNAGDQASRADLSHLSFLTYKVGGRLHFECVPVADGVSMVTRECPFCGKGVPVKLVQCSHCRETLPEMPRVRNGSSSGNNGSGQIRRGLLFMLLAAVIGYFAGGYSSLKLPIPILPALSSYLAPLLFLSGLGLTVHGYYLYHKSAPRRT